MRRVKKLSSGVILTILALTAAACGGHQFSMNGGNSQMICAGTYPDYPAASVPAVLAVKTGIAETPPPQCPACPIVLECDCGDSTIAIVSFQISDAEIADNGKKSITYQTVVSVVGDSFPDIKLDCYDEGGFFIDSAIILSAGKDGEQFRVSESAYIPMDTAEIRITAD